MTMYIYTTEGRRLLSYSHSLPLACSQAAENRILLRKANLEQADLRDAKLMGLRASLSSFRGANLQDADMSAADLSFADLSYADLRGTIFRGADLRSSIFSHSDMRGVDVRDCNLRHVNLRDCDLDGVDLTRAYGLDTFDRWSV
jgi:uncharacterized protein YjbI with pentapeptide repeats